MSLMDAFTAIVKATTDDPTGHLPNCGYTEERQTCGCAEWGKRLHDTLAQMLADERERIAQEIEALPLTHHSRPGIGRDAAVSIARGQA